MNPSRGWSAPPQRADAGSWAVAEGVHLDARRAVYLAKGRILLVADLHLGYAWAQRQRGQLLPIGEDDTLTRLNALCADWAPEVLMVLGDLVHAVASPEGIREAVIALVRGLPSSVRLEVVLGNHDLRLESRLIEWGVPLPCAEERREGQHRFIHGHLLPTEGAGVIWTFSGHEHPALELGDGGTTSAKVPAFLVGDGRVVLPAFSHWAGGCVLGRQPLLGEWARAARFEKAIACLGPRLLPIPWNRLPRGVYPAIS